MHNSTPYVRAAMPVSAAPPSAAAYAAQTMVNEWSLYAKKSINLRRQAQNWGAERLTQAVGSLCCIIAFFAQTNNICRCRRWRPMGRGGARNAWVVGAPIWCGQRKYHKGTQRRKRAGRVGGIGSARARAAPETSFCRGRPRRPEIEATAGDAATALPAVPRVPPRSSQREHGLRNGASMS